MLSVTRHGVKKEPAMTTTVTPADTRLDIAHVRQLTAEERRSLTDAGGDKSPDERKAILAEQVALLVARGRRVEPTRQYRSLYYATLVHGQRLEHGLDRLPRVLTRSFGGEKREIVAVDRAGNVTVEDA
jgi:hypothetical protein